MVSCGSTDTIHLKPPPPLLRTIATIITATSDPSLLLQYILLTYHDVTIYVFRAESSKTD